MDRLTRRQATGTLVITVIVLVLSTGQCGRYTCICVCGGFLCLSVSLFVGMDGSMGGRMDGSIDRWTDRSID